MGPPEEKQQAFRDLVGAYIVEHGEKVTTADGHEVYWSQGLPRGCRDRVLV
jgi:hypothetical protein